MKSAKSTFIGLFFLFISAHAIQAQQTKTFPQLGKSSLKEVIAAMTLEEKASLVVGAGLKIDPSIVKMLGKEMQRMVPQPGSLAARTKNPVQPRQESPLKSPDWAYRVWS